MSSQKSPHGNPKHIYTYIYIYAPDAASKQVIFSSFQEGKKPQLIQLNSQIPQLEPDS